MKKPLQGLKPLQSPVVKRGDKLSVQTYKQSLIYKTVPEKVIIIKEGNVYTLKATEFTFTNLDDVNNFLNRYCNMLDMEAEKI